MHRNYIIVSDLAGEEKKAIGTIVVDTETTDPEEIVKAVTDILRQESGYTGITQIEGGVLPPGVPVDSKWMNRLVPLNESKQLVDELNDHYVRNVGTPPNEAVH